MFGSDVSGLTYPLEFHSREYAAVSYAKPSVGLGHDSTIMDVRADLTNSLYRIEYIVVWG